MRVVTKRGDDGTTSTLNGVRVSKSSDIIEFVGAVDELQSFLGVIKTDKSYEIEEIQYDLYKVMAHQDVDVEKLDGFITNLTVPDIREFVLPKGFIHVARTVCRRAERIAVRIDHPSVAYLNRLSDYLYILNFN